MINRNISLKWNCVSVFPWGNGKTLNASFTYFYHLPTLNFQICFWLTLFFFFPKVAHLQGIYFTVCMFSGNQTQGLGIVSSKFELSKQDSELEFEFKVAESNWTDIHSFIYIHIYIHIYIYIYIYMCVCVCVCVCVCMCVCVCVCICFWQTLNDGLTMVWNVSEYWSVKSSSFNIL